MNGEAGCVAATSVRVIARTVHSGSPRSTSRFVTNLVPLFVQRPARLPRSQVYWATWDTADISSCGFGPLNMYRPPSGTSVKLQRTIPCRSSRN